MKIFAYGSNMHVNRLRKRVPSATKVSNAFIEGFKLMCNKVSNTGSSKGNIVKSNNQGDIVWGVVFEIDESEKSNLDRAEGLGQGYNETTLTFTDKDNNSIEAQVYLADDNSIDNQLKPFDWYKLFILDGAKQNQLPEDYIEKIESFDFEVDKDENRRNQMLKILQEDV